MAVVSPATPREGAGTLARVARRGRHTATGTTAEAPTEVIVAALVVEAAAARGEVEALRAELRRAPLP